MARYEDLPPQLPADEIARLARIVQAGGPEAQAAIEAIVGANVGLVVSVAKKYVRAGVMSIEDATQEGIFGLREAAERFDPARGTQFSTFAVCRIRGAILDAVRRLATNVRLPDDVQDLVSRYPKLVSRFEAEMWRQPRIDEIAQLLGLDETGAERIQMLARSSLSLDTPAYGEEGNGTLGDVMAGSEAGPLEQAEESQLSERMDKALGTLTKREAEVLRRLYTDPAQPSAADLGREMGLTRERIRQLEQSALAKLRNTMIKEWL